MQPDKQQDNWQQPPQTQSTPPVTLDQNSVPPIEGVAQPESTSLEPESHAAVFEAEADTELVRWQAPERLSHERASTWYIVLAIVAIILTVIAILVIRSYTFAALIPVMAVALVVYVRRPPMLHQYILSRKGLHIDDKLLPYDNFKEFGLMVDDVQHSFMLIPRKRLQPGVSVYFPEEVGEAVVDILAARLPMRELTLDTVDKIIRKLRI